MGITLRRAVKEDCSRLLELIKELANYEKAPDEVTVTLKHFEESGFGEKPVWWAIVATSASNSLSKGEEDQASDNQAEEILGFALYYIRYSTWKGQRIYLEDLLVTEKARGKGVGKLLMDRLIEEARERNINAIVWQVLDWNEPAINFYKKYETRFDNGWVNCSLEIK